MTKTTLPSTTTNSRSHIYGAPNFDLHQVWLRAGSNWSDYLVFLLALIPVPPYISILLALSLLLIPAYYHLSETWSGIR